MIKTSDLPAIFCRKPILLVVEDMLTKEYLLHSWGAEQKHFEVIAAGGHDVVQGCSAHLRKHGALNTYCVVDKDFRDSNKIAWRDAGTIDLRTTRHEIENYLLDWAALEGCGINQLGQRKNALEIEGWAKAEAGKQVFWLACRKTLQAIKCKIDIDFPEHPSLGEVTSAEQAENYILGTPWMGSLQARTTEIGDVGRLHDTIADAVTHYNACLANDSWRSEFSGKEIFRAIRGKLYNSGRVRDDMPDETLAVSVAKWQVARNCVPADIVEICSALKFRVGLR